MNQCRITREKVKKCPEAIWGVCEGCNVEEEEDCGCGCGMVELNVRPEPVKYCPCCGYTPEKEE